MIPKQLIEKINYRSKSAKEVNGLYNENYNSLVKEIEEDTNKREVILCSYVTRIGIMKTCILLKITYKF